MTEQYYIYQQLEPEDIIITGNRKRHRPVFILSWEKIGEHKPEQNRITEEQDDAAQDEYLKKHGV